MLSNTLQGYSIQQLVARKERTPERGSGNVLSWFGLGEQPCYLARVRGVVRVSQSSETLAVGELGKMCRKEHGKSLFCRLSSLLACHGFKAAWASGPGGLTCRSWC